MHGEGDYPPCFARERDQGPARNVISAGIAAAPSARGQKSFEVPLFASGPQARPGTGDRGRH